MNLTERRSSQPQTWRSSMWFTTLVVSMACFTDVLFYGLGVPFLPIVLHKRLGFLDKEVQLWNSYLLGVYGAAILIASPTCGYFADRCKSRKSPLLLGLVAMAGSTAMMQCGSTISALVVARICQGLSAAILYSAGMAFLCNAADKDKFGRAMGFITLAITAGTFLGPSLGGILYHVGRERAVFSLAYGVLAVDVVLRYLVVEKKKPHNQSLKTNEGPNYGTMDSNSHEETAAKGPTLLLLKSPRLLTAFFGWFVVGTILSAIDTVLPIFVRSTFAWSSAGAGVIFIALVTPNFGGPFYGRMVDSSKHAGRLMAIAGFTLCFPSFVLLRLVAYDGITAQILLCGLLFTIGFGVAIVGPSLFVEVARSVSELEAKLPGVFGKHGAGAKAYGLYASSYAAGQLLGPLWAGGITSTLGWDVMTCFMGLFCGITAIVMGLFLGGSIFHRSSKMIG